ncbi:heavy metal-associated isoprenylated plant protein 36-like [Sesamum indicum]|uniref:Heavy metal-associated isoprenylated plant protein 36-like n=1 Tax=Sesamum indicum TaxID=4182 RepID=A0A6I9TXX6_SESIN|nr:heavy metal-associated isoprenylated plant protein 36-like [Sesamum indicum]
MAVYGRSTKLFMASPVFSFYGLQHDMCLTVVLSVVRASITQCLLATGIYDIYVDLCQQKITVVGWADPDIIVKAIMKTRKRAVISSHSEQFDQPKEPTPEGGATNGGAPLSESTKLPAEKTPPEGGAIDGGATPLESTNPPADMTTPEESLKEQKDQENPSRESAIATSSGLTGYPEPKDRLAIHVIHHQPPNYGYRYGYNYSYQQGYGGQWHDSHGGLGFTREQSQPPQPVCVTHGYNTYKPSLCVTEYAYPVPDPPPRYSQYSRPDDYSQDYYSGNIGNGNITSMFSEDNPNACRIV